MLPPAMCVPRDGVRTLVEDAELWGRTLGSTGGWLVILVPD